MRDLAGKWGGRGAPIFKEAGQGGMKVGPATDNQASVSELEEFRKDWTHDVGRALFQGCLPGAV